jgi:hypothetical protein
VLDTAALHARITQAEVAARIGVTPGPRLRDRARHGRRDWGPEASGQSIRPNEPGPTAGEVTGPPGAPAVLFHSVEPQAISGNVRAHDGSSRGEDGAPGGIHLSGLAERQRDHAWSTCAAVDHGARPPRPGRRPRPNGGQVTGNDLGSGELAGPQLIGPTPMVAQVAGRHGPGQHQLPGEPRARRPGSSWATSPAVSYPATGRGLSSGLRPGGHVQQPLFEIGPCPAPLRHRAEDLLKHRKLLVVRGQHRRPST